MLQYIEKYWDALIMMLAEMAPYLLLGFFFAGLLRAFVPKSIYRKHLAPRNMKSVVKAALLGIPLPLCSCGVIPTSVGLRREGASHGACTSFLIATPQTGVDSIAATYSLMGLPFAIVRPIAALFTSMFGGWLVNKFAHEDETLSEETTKETAECNCDQHPSPSFWNNFISAMRYAFVEMLQDVGKWLVVGLLIASARCSHPDVRLRHRKHTHRCVADGKGADTRCGIGVADGWSRSKQRLDARCGQGVRAPHFAVISHRYNYWRRSVRTLHRLPTASAMVQSKRYDHERRSLCPLLLLLVNAFVDRLRHSWMLRREKSKEEGGKQNIKDGDTVSDITIYDVKEMACNHCKANVEKIISGIAGVESVEVDLVKGIAYVHGQHDHSEVERQVTANGYPTTLKV